LFLNPFFYETVDVNVPWIKKEGIVRMVVQASGQWHKIFSISYNNVQLIE
jgi:hypothetical protein